VKDEEGGEKRAKQPTSFNILQTLFYSLIFLDSRHQSFEIYF
jgi:hypothetical protein